MTHFSGESWNGNHLPNPSAVYGSSEVAFPQIWNQEGQPTYNDIIGFQDLGEFCELREVKIKVLVRFEYEL